MLVPIVLCVMIQNGGGQGDSMTFEETDWSKLGCPTKQKVDKMIEKFYSDLDLNDVSHIVHDMLYQYGFMPEEILKEVYHRFFMNHD